MRPSFRRSRRTDLWPPASSAPTLERPRARPARPGSSLTDDLRTDLETGLAGRYAIERELGHGGMATVYLAQDVRHGRPVALGRRAEAIRTVDAALAEQGTDPDLGMLAAYDYAEARFFALAGDRDRALAALERLAGRPSPDWHTPALWRLDLWLAGLRDDPRFRRAADASTAERPPPSASGR